MFGNFFNKKIESPIVEDKSAGTIDGQQIVDKGMGIEKEISKWNYTCLVDKDDLVLDTEKTQELKNLWAQIEENLPQDFETMNEEEQDNIIKEIRAKVEGQQ